jgi:hypothetical protein
MNDNILKDHFPVYKLGIQGPAGTKFYLNGGQQPITIGKYGIYELDLTNLGGFISSLSFEKTDATIIVDIVYEKEGGTAS